MFLRINLEHCEQYQTWPTDNYTVTTTMQNLDGVRCTLLGFGGEKLGNHGAKTHMLAFEESNLEIDQKSKAVSCYAAAACERRLYRNKKRK